MEVHPRILLRLRLIKLLLFRSSSYCLQRGQGAGVVVVLGLVDAMLRLCIKDVLRGKLKPLKDFSSLIFCRFNCFVIIPANFLGSRHKICFKLPCSTLRAFVFSNSLRSYSSGS